MYRQLFCQYLKGFLTDEKGEGMVGWILATLLTVTIVVVLHGAITDWLGPFWSTVQSKIESIV